MIFLTFAEICDALPEGFNWGDPLTPAVFKHIESTIEQAAPATPADHSRDSAEPIAFTSQWDLDQVKQGEVGRIYKTSEDSDVIPLYMAAGVEPPSCGKHASYPAEFNAWFKGEWPLCFDAIERNRASADVLDAYGMAAQGWIGAIESQQDAAIESQRSGNGESS